MLTTIPLIPTEWILTISHLVHIMLANMTTVCISALSIMFPWNISVKLMHPKAPAKKFFWPDHEDKCWIPLNHMICRVKPLS